MFQRTIPRRSIFCCQCCCEALCFWHVPRPAGRRSFCHKGQLLHGVRIHHSQVPIGASGARAASLLFRSLMSVSAPCSSRILSNFQPHFNATAVQRLLDAGAVPIGKTVMDEFGMGSFTLNREGVVVVLAVVAVLCHQVLPFCSQSFARPPVQEPARLHQSRRRQQRWQRRSCCRVYR